MTLIQNHIPLYLKLYWKIKDQISFQEFLPGDRLPTVEQLHEQYSISQSTVHKALDLLEKEGLIVKQRAQGIFVKESVKAQQWDPVFTPESFRAELKMFEFHQTSEGWISATKSLCNIFKNQEGVFKQNRIYRWQASMVHQEEKRRKVFLTAYLPAWLIAGVPNSKVTDYSANGFIDFGEFRTDRIVRITRPWICDADIAERLGILEGTAVFRRMLLHYTKEDRLLAYGDYVATTHATYKETRIDWEGR